MGILAEKGVEQPITPGGPAVRMVDLETVRAEFYAQWPAEGTAREKAEARRQACRRAVETAQKANVIGVRETGGTIRVWLVSRTPNMDDDA
jgi:hypothetical protein